MDKYKNRNMQYDLRMDEKVGATKSKNVNKLDGLIEEPG